MLDNRKTLEEALYTRYRAVQTRLYAVALKSRAVELRTRAEQAKGRAAALTTDGRRQNSKGINFD
jgi:hypothetical protein